MERQVSVLVLILLLVPLGAPVAPAADDARPASQIPPGPYPTLPAKPEGFVTSDGNVISYAVHRPSVPMGQRVPIILSAGPYFGQLDDPVHVPSRTRFTGFLVDNFVSHGYAVVAASVRGTGWSEGCMELMSRREATDISELITFLAGQSWADGNVAMAGKSYDGTTPWMVAALGNPHLKTIVPIAGVTDLGDLLVHHGVPQSRTSIFHGVVYWPSGFGVDTLTGRVDTKRDAGDRAWNAACPEAAKGLASGTWAATTGDKHTIRTFDAYWRERSWQDDVVANYTGSVFVVHGLQDFNVVPRMVVPFFDTLPQEKKLLLGQWAHEYPDERVITKRDDFAFVLKSWFDKHLKNDAAADTGPVVEVADAGLAAAGAAAWRALEAWPQPPDEVRAYHLSAPGHLTRSEPIPFREVIATPAGANVMQSACNFKHAARFVTLASPGAYRISGIPTLDVTLDPPTPGAVVAVLCVDGRVAAHGATNTLYADTGDTPRAFDPTRPLDVRIEFEPVEHTVPPGARLALAVLMEDYVGDRAGAQYGATASAGVAVLVGGTLVLPVS